MSFIQNLLASKGQTALSKEKLYKPKAPAAKIEPTETAAEPELALKKAAGIKNPLLARNKEAAVTSPRTPRNAMHAGIARGFRP